MEEMLRQRLTELDLQGWESPPDFDYLKEMKTVEIIKPKIEEIIQHELWHDTGVQDASFFTDLVWLDERYYSHDKGGQLVPHLAIRFSSFDRMVTIYSANEDRMKVMQYAPQLAQLLEENNFKYIPIEWLAEPYPAKENSMSYWTWFTRFFDYL